MFQIGWAEMMVIGVVALIVIGPEDLPDMFRQMGRFTAKLRAMGREFQKAMDQAAKESGVKDVAADLAKVTSPKAMGLDAVKAAADKFEKWDPIKNAANPAPKATKAAAAAAAGEAAADAADLALQDRTLTALSSMTPPSTLTSVADLKAAGAAGKDAVAQGPENSIMDPATKAMGPATKALYDKQAARAAVLAESAAKLKAIEEGTEAAPAPAAEKPKAKARAAKAAKPVTASEPVPQAKSAKVAPAKAASVKPAPVKPAAVRPAAVRPAGAGSAKPKKSADPVEAAVKAPRKSGAKKADDA